MHRGDQDMPRAGAEFQGEAISVVHTSECDPVMLLASKRGQNEMLISLMSVFPIVVLVSRRL